MEISCLFGGAPEVASETMVPVGSDRCEMQGKAADKGCSLAN